MQPQYSQGAAPSHHPPAYVPPEVSTNGASITSSLRQWRKKDYVEKQQPTEQSPHENSTHIARIAPHTYYPRITDDVCHYQPQYSEFGSPYKPTNTTPVKYSEIVDNSQPQSIEHINAPAMAKQKEKEYGDVCSHIQPHMKHYQDEMSLKQAYSDGSKPYSEHTIHHQYVSKDPFLQKQPPMHQYIPKETYQQFLPKYGMQTQYNTQSYPQDASNFLAHLNKINPRMVQSIINDTHLHDSQISLYPSLDQRAYPQPQPQRMYHPSIHSNPNHAHRNIPQPYNYSQSYNTKPNMQSNDPYNRVPQYQHNVTKYLPDYKMNSAIEQSIPNISPPQRVLPEGIHMNYAPMPPNISPNFPHCGQLEYAQHYQHRRAQLAQEYYPHAGFKPAYIQNHQISPDGGPPDPRSRKSSLKQYLETWVEEDISGNLTDVIVSNLEDAENIDNLKGAMRVKAGGSQEQALYILDTTEIPNETLPHFLHLQQFEKLPDNIRGYYHSTNAIAAGNRRYLVDPDDLPEKTHIIRSSKVRTEDIPNVIQNQSKTTDSESGRNAKDAKTSAQNLEEKVVQIHIVEESEAADARTHTPETVIIQSNMYQEEDFAKIISEPENTETKDTEEDVDALQNMPMIDECNKSASRATEEKNSDVEGNNEPLNEDSDASEILNSRRSSICSIYKEMEHIHGEAANLQHNIKKPNEVHDVSNLSGDGAKNDDNPPEFIANLNDAKDEPSQMGSKVIIEENELIEKCQLSENCQEDVDCANLPPQCRSSPVKNEQAKNEFQISDNHRQVNKKLRTAKIANNSSLNEEIVEITLEQESKKNEINESNDVTISTHPVVAEEKCEEENHQVSENLEKERVQDNCSEIKVDLENSPAEKVDYFNDNSASEDDIIDEQQDLVESAVDNPVPIPESIILESIMNDATNSLIEDDEKSHEEADKYEEFCLEPTSPSPLFQNVDEDNVPFLDQSECKNFEDEDEIPLNLSLDKKPPDTLINVRMDETFSVSEDVCISNDLLNTKLEEIAKTINNEFLEDDLVEHPMEDLSETSPSSLPEIPRVIDAFESEPANVMLSEPFEDDFNPEDIKPNEILPETFEGHSNSNIEQTHEIQTVEINKNEENEIVPEKFTDAFEASDKNTSEMLPESCEDNVTINTSNVCNSHSSDFLQLDEGSNTAKPSVVDETPPENILEISGGSSEEYMDAPNLEPNLEETSNLTRVKSITELSDSSDAIMPTLECMVDLSIDNRAEYVTFSTAKNEDNKRPRARKKIFKKRTFGKITKTKRRRNMNTSQYRNGKKRKCPKKEEELVGSEEVVVSNHEEENNENMEMKDKIMNENNLETEKVLPIENKDAVSEEGQTKEENAVINEEATEDTNVVYQIENNNVILQIADELLEINVVVQNGKKVIMVKAFSDATIMNNDEQICEEIISTEETIHVDVSNEQELNKDEEIHMANDTNLELTNKSEEILCSAVEDDVCIYNEEIVSSSSEIETALELLHKADPIQVSEKSPTECVKIKKHVSWEDQEKTKCLQEDRKVLQNDVDVKSKLHSEITIKKSLKSPKTKGALKFIDTLDNAEGITEQNKVPCKIAENSNCEKNKTDLLDKAVGKARKRRCSAIENNHKIAGSTTKMVHKPKVSKNDVKVESHNKNINLNPAPEKQLKKTAVIKEDNLNKPNLKVKEKMVKSKEAGKDKASKPLNSRSKKMTVKEIKFEEKSKTAKEEKKINISDNKQPVRSKSLDNNLKKSKVKGSKQEKRQISVQENSITSSTSLPENETKERISNNKLLPEKTDDWEDDVSKLIDNSSAKRRLSLQEYQSRKQTIYSNVELDDLNGARSKSLSISNQIHEGNKEPHPVEAQIVGHVRKRHSVQNRMEYRSVRSESDHEVSKPHSLQVEDTTNVINDVRPQSPTTISVNFSNKTYSRSTASKANNNMICDLNELSKSLTRFSDNNIKKNEESLTSTIELDLPKTNRTNRMNVTINTARLDSDLDERYEAINKYTKALIAQNHNLMQRFLEQKRLSVTELATVTKIIQYKRFLQSLTKCNKNGETNSEPSRANNTNKTSSLLCNGGTIPEKPRVVIDLKSIEIDKIPLKLPEKRKRKRFRCLYSDEETDMSAPPTQNQPKTAALKRPRLNNLVPDDAERNVVDYSVRRSRSQGQLTLVFKRSFKSDPKMQPFVKLERVSSIDLLAKTGLR